MAQNESAIEQINLSVNELEDRLLLKVGLADKTEVNVWITRRICKTLWSMLHDTAPALMPTTPQFLAPAIVTPQAKSEAIESFSREATEQKQIENLDFKSEYIADRASRSDSPFLATQCFIISVANTPPQLELQCTNGKSVKIALNNQLVHALIQMMQLAMRQAAWDLVTTEEVKEATVIPIDQTLH